MPELGKLWVAIGADAGGFNKALQSAKKNLDDVGRAARYTFAALTAKMTVATAYAVTFEKSQAKLKAAIMSNAGVINRTTGHWTDYADEMRRVSVFSKPAYMDAIALMMSYKMQDKAITQLLPKVADLAAEFGYEMPQVARALGKSLGGSLWQLSRMGVVFDEATKKAFQHATAQERVAILYQALSNKVGPFATEMRKTIGGAILGIQFSFREFMEQLGLLGKPAIVIGGNKLAAMLDNVGDTIKKLTPEEKSLALYTGMAALALTGFASSLPVLMFAIKGVAAAVTFMLSPFTLLAVTFAGFVAAWAIGWDNIETSALTSSAKTGGAFATMVEWLLTIKESAKMGWKAVDEFWGNVARRAGSKWGEALGNLNAREMMGPRMIRGLYQREGWKRKKVSIPASTERLPLASASTADIMDELRKGPTLAQKIKSDAQSIMSGIGEMGKTLFPEQTAKLKDFHAEVLKMFADGSKSADEYIKKQEQMAQAEAEALEKRMAGQKAWQDVMARAKQIFEDVMTPAERFKQIQQELTDLLSQGAINAETYARAIKKAMEDAANAGKDSTDSMATAFDGLKAAIKNVGGEIENVFVEIYRTGKFNFQKLVDSIIEELIKIGVRKAIIGPLFKSLGIEGFASGGIVPGPIGAPVPAIVHGGEEVVSVRDRGRSRGGYGYGQTVNNYYINAIDTQSFSEYVSKPGPAMALNAVTRGGIDRNTMLRRTVLEGR